MNFGVLLGAFCPGPIQAVFHPPYFIVAIIWVALAALATHAIEQGSNPSARSNAISNTGPQSG
jgi:hypothetical protein